MMCKIKLTVVFHFFRTLTLQPLLCYQPRCHFSSSTNHHHLRPNTSLCFSHGETENENTPHSQSQANGNCALQLHLKKKKKKNQLNASSLVEGRSVMMMMMRVLDAVVATLLAAHCLLTKFMSMAAWLPDPFIIVIPLKALSFLYFGLSVMFVLLLKLLPLMNPGVNIGPRERSSILLCSTICFLDGLYCSLVYMCGLWLLIPFQIPSVRVKGPARNWVIRIRMSPVHVHGAGNSSTGFMEWVGYSYFYLV